MKDRPILPMFSIKTLIYAFLIVYAIAILYPLFWIAFSSLKTNLEMYTSTWALPVSPKWSNYVKAIKAGMAQYILNSLIVTSISVTIIVALSALAGYAFARLSFWGSLFLFVLIISGYMFPPQAGLIPLYWIFRWLNLLDTYWCLIVSYVAFGIPFSVLLLRTYFLSIPSEIEDAAKIDGCGMFSRFLRIILPMSKTALSTVAIFQSVFLWNEFLFALIFINTESIKTLPLGLASLSERYTTDWTTTLAGIVIGTVPLFVFYLFLQRQFIKGMVGTAIKG